MRVFMNPHDYEVMLDSADSRRGRLAMRLMGEAGYRVGELPKLIYGELRQSTHPDVDLWFWPVKGKDSKQRDTEGKRRDPWINDDLKQTIDRYAENENIRESSPIFRCQRRTLRREVERAREHAVMATNNSNYAHVSSHDFRAYFATNMTLREGVNPEIVMELGGWDDRKTYRTRYLDAKFDDIIQMHLAAAGVIDIETEDVPMTEYMKLRKEIQELKAMIADIDFEITVEDSADIDETQLDEFL